MHMVFARIYGEGASNETWLDGFDSVGDTGGILTFWLWPENDGFCRSSSACWDPVGLSGAVFYLQVR